LASIVLSEVVIFVSEAKPVWSVAEKLMLPADVLPEAARVTVSGTSEVYVENHGGLSLLTPECIEIRTRYGCCRVSGRDLCLAYMTRTKIVIRGFVIAVEFV
jgi:sporulation protein YqfC